MNSVVLEEEEMICITYKWSFTSCFPFLLVYGLFMLFSLIRYYIFFLQSGNTHRLSYNFKRAHGTNSNRNHAYGHGQLPSSLVFYLLCDLVDSRHPRNGYAFAAQQEDYFFAYSSILLRDTFYILYYLLLHLRQEREACKGIQCGALHRSIVCRLSELLNLFHFPHLWCVIFYILCYFFDYLLIISMYLSVYFLYI